MLCQSSRAKSHFTPWIGTPVAKAKQKPTSAPADILDSEPVTKLVTLLEESTRASPDIVRYFLEPAPGVLSRALSKRHHIIFGRRGSGKSSLLRKAVSDLTVNRVPIGYVDLEQFEGHSYPDVLVSILIKIFNEFKTWLDTAAVAPATKTSFWKKLFGAVPKKAAFNKTSTQELVDEIGQVIANLNTLLLENEEVSKKETERADRKGGAESSASVGAAPLPAKVAGKVSTESGRSYEVQSEYSHRKIEVLHRNIMIYKELFSKISGLAGGATYLLLDDLYFIRKADQALVVDYFHRIAKGSELWLKVGTIRHRSNYYRFGDPPLGMKLGDDADEIDLDITLEKFNSTKGFLLTILDNFAAVCEVDVRAILTDEREIA